MSVLIATRYKLQCVFLATYIVKRGIRIVTRYALMGYEHGNGFNITLYLPVCF